MATQGNSDIQPAQPPMHRLILLFTIVGSALLMFAIDTTIVATALHTLQVDLNTSIAWTGWTITAYSFGLVLMFPIAGKLNALYGARRVFLTSIVLFTASSFCCGFATHIYALIVLRVCQAIGGAGFMPSATAIVVGSFGTARDRAVGLFGSIFPLGAMIGPVAGGLILTYLSWRWVFFVNVPLGLVIFILGLRYIPVIGARGQERVHTIDVPGLGLMALVLLGVMVGWAALSDPNDSNVALYAGLPLVVSVFSASAFVFHIRRACEPFVPFQLIAGHGFGQVNLISILLGGIPLGVIALIPLYATNRYGLTALDAGTLLVAQGIATGVFSVWAAFIMRRTGYRAPLYAGGIIIVLGAILLVMVPLGSVSPYWWLAGSTFVVGIGYGIINPASRNACLQLIPEQSATIASLRSMFLQIGIIGTVSVTTAIIARSPLDGGHIQSWVYLGAAAIMGMSLMLIRGIPEHRGVW